MIAAEIPAEIYKLPIGERVRWARDKKERISHDVLVTRLGRSNRGHLIKIEKGIHVPRPEFRDALALALAVPRELFADDPQEAAPLGDTFRGSGDSADGRGASDRSAGTGAAGDVTEDAA